MTETTCPECGAECETPDHLHDHVTDAHDWGVVTVLGGDGGEGS